MPVAIERSLATPVISAFLPARKPMVSLAGNDGQFYLPIELCERQRAGNCAPWMARLSTTDTK
jgi:hypothetical protein